MAAPARGPGGGTAVPTTTPATTESGDLGAPLYIAWQVTNECDLACLHCIEESGPGKAFDDELNDEQVFAFLEEVIDLEVPYLSFSGGEPMVHRRFFDMVEYICGRNGQLKIETNGHSPNSFNRAQFSGFRARRPVRANFGGRGNGRDP